MLPSTAIQVPEVDAGLDISGRLRRPALVLRKLDQRNERNHRYDRNTESISSMLPIPCPSPTPAASTTKMFGAFGRAISGSSRAFC